MKSLLILFIFGLLLAPIVFENSFAQSVSSPPTTKVFFQIKLYDKNGNFYGYIQPHMQIFNLDALIKFFAPYSTNSSVTYKGYNYVLMKSEDDGGGSNHFEQLGGYFVNAPVNGVQQEVFYGWHDSYLANAGDKEKVFWEFLIPSK